MYGIAGAVAPGGDTDDLLEDPGKVALVRKTCFQADIRDGQAPGEQAPGVIHPFLDDVGVGRKPHGGAEGPQKMKLAQICDGGELAEGDVLRKPVIEIFEQGLHRCRFAAVPSRIRLPAVRVARDHVGKDGIETGLPFDSDVRQVQSVEERKNARRKEWILDDGRRKMRKSARARQYLGSNLLKK